MFYKKIVPVLAIATMVFSSMSFANAVNLAGDTINLQYYFNGGAYDAMGGPGSIIAGSTSYDFGDNLLAPYFTVSASASQIIFDYKGSPYWANSGTSFSSGGLYIANGILITDNSSIFSNIVVNPSTDLTNFSISNVTFDSHNIAIDWNDRQTYAGMKVVLDINPSAVPVPASIWLFGTSILGFFGLKRRKH